MKVREGGKGGMEGGKEGWREGGREGEREGGGEGGREGGREGEREGGKGRREGGEAERAVDSLGETGGPKVKDAVCLHMLRGHFVHTAAVRAHRANSTLTSANYKHLPLNSSSNGHTHSPTIHTLAAYHQPQRRQNTSRAV